MMSLNEAIYSIRRSNTANDGYNHSYVKALFNTSKGKSILSNLYYELENIKLIEFSFPKIDDKRPNAEAVFKFASKNYVFKKYGVKTLFPVEIFLTEQCHDYDFEDNASKLEPLFKRKDSNFLNWVTVKIVMSSFYIKRMKELDKLIHNIMETEEFKIERKKARKIVAERLMRDMMCEYSDVLSEEALIKIIRDIQIDLVMEG